ncbi:hypothetical protein H257_06637 [Aphanomyces astaci]|uniref:Major facilitator superfamily (MFS) profile domain-containing protein n=1 Tax=Aphanomyces astaci TaxID=112090 RepID=W4GMR6_APHAT|nr:hypothetical protein H257_06637 [Aphanomyces astaci]ETV80319.1 hypothetical protein H257_06637 [Aphanomyces astaci]|eukprot:XP_009830243.1 hypothetical protein H257_06637 [Aphanomyces astaci]
MKDAKECLQTSLLLSISFLLLFTSYMAIEVLETSIIPGKCHGCMEGTMDGICQAGPVCQDKLQFSCDQTCVAPFEECESSLGSTILGVTYLCLMLSAFMTPLITNYFGEKNSMVGGSFSFILFAFANLIVALYPTKTSLHWWVMIPAALLLGVFASVLWIAQASYLTRLSVIYAQYMNVPAVSSMGTFNGSFYAFYKMSRITGNLLSSFVLGFLGWSTASLFAVYTGISVAGSVLMATLPDLVHPAGDESTALLKAAELPIESSSAATTLRALWDIAKDRRMVVLIPVWLLSGLQLGFVSGEFTVHFIRQSLGSASIGYVMATFGVVNVVCSFWFGKLADKIGLFFAQMVGFGSLFVAYALCMWSDVVKCDGQWTLVLGIAVLLSVGGASCTTLANVILGQEFPSNAVNAFSLFRVYNSGATSASFFFFKYLSLEGRLWVLMLNVVLATASFAVYSIRHRQIAGVR